MINELTGGIPQHMSYFEAQCVRAGRYDIVRDLRRSTIEKRASLNTILGTRFAGKNLGQVDAICRDIMSQV